MSEVNVDAIIEQSNTSAVAIIAKAIREYFKDDEEKMKVPWSRQMAEIIDSGFLDCLLSKTDELVTRNRTIANREEERARIAQQNVNERQRRYDQILSETKELQRQAAEINELLDKKDADGIMLFYAKRAYEWIYEQTRSVELASKAFNSYLIGHNKKLDEFNADGQVCATAVRSPVRRF